MPGTFNFLRRTLVLGAALGTGAAALFVAAPASAQTPAWPARNVRLVLPLGPGSGADIGARLIAERLSKAWGQAVVVENKPGGDSVVAITSVLTANDDHILLWGPSAAFTAHPYTHAKIPYDINEIFPIARVSNTLVLIGVSSSIKPTTIAGIVALARGEPGVLNWASVTGLNDFVFQSFVKSEKLEMVRVPYRDPVQAANDVGEGRVQVYAAAYAIQRPVVEGGKIRPIAFMNTVRAPILPGIPTVREAGFPTLEFDGMVGVFGTKAVSEAARRRISADVRAALEDPIVRDRLTSTGQLINPGDTPEFVAAIAEQRKSAAGAAEVLGIKAAQ
jgi:tripartite-type tricarboxylate transporter receptor subunit TctC